MLENFEFNPIAAAAGLMGGALSLFVSSSVETGIVIKLATFAVTSVVCYFVFSGIMNK